MQHIKNTKKLGEFQKFIDNDQQFRSKFKKIVAAVDL